jgi:preprotein translocase subunit SecD
MWRFSCAAIASCLICAATVRGDGTKLVYQIEPPEKSTQASAKIDDVVAAVKHRVDALGVKDVEVKPDGKDQITVEFSKADDKAIDRVKKSLSQRGHLEFRIVANRRDVRFDDLIKLAKNSPKGEESGAVRDADGKLLAEWVRLPARDLHLSADSFDLRDAEDGKHDILVAGDDQNVTGQYIVKVRAAKRLTGTAIEFELNDKGGKLFKALTAENLPRADGSLSWLGIILDHQLINAAVIGSEIGRHGEIIGDFTQAEAADLVATIGSGELPAKLRLTGEPQRDHR